RGTEAAAEASAQASTPARDWDSRIERSIRARISYPADGTVIALDPDIPSSLERVAFEASGARELKFVLNGQALGPAGSPLLWHPEKPGPYELALVDSSGHVQDSVHFQVRGTAQLAEPDAAPPAPASELDP